MAKKSVTDHQKELEAMVVAASAQSASQERVMQKQKEHQEQMSTRLVAFEQKWTALNSKSRRVAVDLGGGTLAQVSTELINWGVRALGRWSKDGWLANNVDLLQSMPHFILGLALYCTEMATRKKSDKGVVSASREVMSEATKLFAQLGFSNLVRAIRFRWGEAEDMHVSMAALQAEKQALLAQLQKKPAAPEKASG